MKELCPYLRKEDSWGCLPSLVMTALHLKGDWWCKLLNFCQGRNPRESCGQGGRGCPQFEAQQNAGTP